MNSTRKQTENKPQTEADLKSADSARKHSSHDNKSHAKAGTQSGAGGGKKQQRHH